MGRNFFQRYLTARYLYAQTDCTFQSLAYHQLLELPRNDVVKTSFYEGIQIHKCVQVPLNIDRK